VQDRFIANLRAAMFFMVPSFAAGLALVYRNRRLRYTEHLVFALHTHAFWFIALAVSVAPLSFIAGLAPLTVPVYGLLAMKRVYGGRWPALLLRAFGVSLLYSFALSLAMAGLGAWALLA